MIETHAIRLRGPWECQSEAAELRRVPMPAPLREAAGEDRRGRLVCRRRFGCPTCLDPHERVWMVVDCPSLSGEARLNGEPLGQILGRSNTVEFELTGRLAERNQFELVFDLGAAAGDASTVSDELLFADVRLEIRG